MGRLCSHVPPYSLISYSYIHSNGTTQGSTESDKTIWLCACVRLLIQVSVNLGDLTELDELHPVAAEMSPGPEEERPPPRESACMTNLRKLQSWRGKITEFISFMKRFKRNPDGSLGSISSVGEQLSS